MGQLEWLAAVVPPTTLFTALAFWFGYVFTSARTAYFGIDASTLEFSTIDYLLRSADAVVLPAVVFLAIVLGTIGMHALMLFIVRRGRGIKWIGIGCLALSVLGTILLAVGIRSMFAAVPGFSHYLATPVLLGGGAAFAAYGFYIVRTMGRLFGPDRQPYDVPLWERGGYVVVAMLIILSLFLATTLYAAALGRGKSQALEQNLRSRPSVVLFSKQSLALPDAVAVTRLDTPDSAYRFRYTGLRLLIRSASKYFLLPEVWSQETGTVIILEDTAEIRLEFQAGQP
jgi:hypothetical protein